MRTIAGIDYALLREVCTRYGVLRLDVFGSVARSEAAEDSDIDLLYTLAPDRRLGWAIEDLAIELSEVFGRRVDLVSHRALRTRLRDNVLAEAEQLWATA